MITTLLGKVALSVGALTMSAGGAAAATGHLPEPAEAALHSMLDTVGLQSDDGASQEATPSTSTVVPTTTAAGGTTTTVTSTTLGSTTTRAVADEGEIEDEDERGPDVSPTSPALHGLCTAWAAHHRDGATQGPGKSDDAVPFAKLAAAAGGADAVETYCEDALGDATHDDDDETSVTSSTVAGASAEQRPSASNGKGGGNSGKGNGSKGSGKGNGKGGNG